MTPDSHEAVALHISNCYSSNVLLNKQVKVSLSNLTWYENETNSFSRSSDSEKLSPVKTEIISKRHESLASKAHRACSKQSSPQLRDRGADEALNKLESWEYSRSNFMFSNKSLL